MNEELLKELSRLQLLRSRYNSKKRMCPLEIKKAEERACIIFDYITSLQNNWNELKKKLERRINSYEERKKLGEGYELTEVMEISLACDKRFLKEMQELEQGKDE